MNKLELLKTIKELYIIYTLNIHISIQIHKYIYIYIYVQPVIYKKYYMLARVGRASGVDSPAHHRHTHTNPTHNGGDTTHYSSGQVISHTREGGGRERRVTVCLSITHTAHRGVTAITLTVHSK